MTTLALAYPATAPTAYVPSAIAGNPVLLAECVSRILAGQPLPEVVRARASAAAVPATAQEGISRVLAGNRAA